MPSACSSELSPPVRADARLSGRDGAEPAVPWPGADDADDEGGAAAAEAGRDDGAVPAGAVLAGAVLAGAGGRGPAGPPGPAGPFGAVGPFAAAGPLAPAGAPAGRAAPADSPAAIVLAVTWSTSSSSDMRAVSAATSEETPSRMSDRRLIVSECLVDSRFRRRSAPS